MRAGQLDYRRYSVIRPLPLATGLALPLLDPICRISLAHLEVQTVTHCFPFFDQTRPLRRRLPAVHGDGASVHKAALLAREEEHHLRNLERVCSAAEWNRGCCKHAGSACEGPDDRVEREAADGKEPNAPLTAVCSSGGNEANISVAVAPGWMQFERMPAAGALE